MTEPLDEDLVQSSQEAIARMVGQSGFEGGVDLPVQMGATDYFPSSRPRRSYSIAQSESSERERPSRREEGDEEEHAEVSRKAQNLEDLYSMFPRIGDGLYRIRVTRLEPRVFHSADHGTFQCAGVLGDFDEPLSMDEFSERFGGNKYRVTVLGPQRPSDPQFDSRGNPLVRSLKSVEFSIQGPPKPDFRPKRQQADEPAVNPMQRQFGSPMSALGSLGLNMGMSMNTEVERERLKNEYLRAEREASERMEANREARQAALQAAQAALHTPTKLVEEVKQQSQQTFDVLRAQNEDLRAQAEKARQEAERLRGELIQRQGDFERRVREAEAEKTAQLKTEHERELRRITEDAARAQERVTSAQRDDLARLTSQHAIELQRLENNATKEREMLLREAERRESSLSRDHDRERTTTRDTYEARIAQLKDTYDARIRDLQLTFERESAAVKEAAAREVQSVRESRDREVEALRNQHEMQSSVSRETTTLRVEMVNAEISRLRDVEARLTTRVSELEAQNAELREKNHKEPLEVIADAKSLLGEIGWAPQADGTPAPAAEDAEGGDWKKTLAKSALGLVDKIPEIAQTVMASRAQAAAVQANAKAQAEREESEQLRRAAEGQRQAQSRAMRALPPGAQPPMLASGQPRTGQAIVTDQRVRPPSSFQPPQTQMGPRAVVQPQQAVVPGGLRRAPREVPSDVVPEPVRSAPTVAPAQTLSPAPAQVPPQAQPDAPQTEPTAPLSEAEQEAAMAQLSPDALEEFFSELDKAIREDVIPAGMWAKGFANKIGVPLAKTLVTQFSADDVIEFSRNNQSSVIPTRSGQDFVKKVWGEVQKL